ncbi:MAG: MBOAT family protein [Acidobacteriota bacterium]|nr:MBOAT family protein [Acidobacteriota bacterium]
MLFNSPRFAIFYAAVFTLFYIVPVSWRKWLLLLASYFFYMSWNYRFILLLLGLTVTDYVAGILIERQSQPRARRAALILSVAANLGFLGFFKYYNFLAGMVAQASGRPVDFFLLHIVLPIGISFHTFQSISYVVDVYRREQRAVRNFLDYALFLAFFPQLVAGPIVRSRNFFHDLHRWKAPSSVEAQSAVFQIAIGLFNKIVLADQFAPIADSYFSNVAAHPGLLDAWSGTFAFAMQIYFDFAGYTSIAIGCALLLGFRFPVNFRRPYLASSVTEFWRRWHISLSQWLRDYLYVPMGGNRRGAFRTYRNLAVTMLLGGLWHGASWNFLIWGGYHGGLLAAERALKGPMKLPRLPVPLSTAFTFALVLIGWVFFRAKTLHDSGLVLRALISSTRGTWQIPAPLMWMVFGTFVLACMEERWDFFERLWSAPAWVRTAALVVLMLSIELFGVTEAAVPFVYFQF